MSTLAILQARVSSTRLPGKVLAPILGEPMIARQVERIRRASRIDDLVIATSSDRSDDPLAAWAEAEGLTVYRGSLDDVLARFVGVIAVHSPDTVVRLTADCPLASPSVIDAVIDHFTASDVDYCSNTLTPTFPDGLDVEVVRARVLTEVAEISTDPAEREHVTLGVYRRPERFSVANYAGDRDLSSLRWTVDTADDLAFVTRVYEALYKTNPGFDTVDILDLIERTPSLGRTTDDGMRNAALQGLETGAMNA
jgi:spore coat polysaccharide biosynthesis protein SpsF